MRRGRIRIRNKMGFQIVTILIFTIILPSIFFFWFIVQRYSNDLLSAAISERENLLEAINKSISLHFDNCAGAVHDDLLRHLHEKLY